MKLRSIFMSLSVGAALLCATAARGQEARSGDKPAAAKKAAAKPAKKAAKKRTRLKASVVMTRGKVSYQKGGRGRWSKVKKGAKFQDGTRIKTGYKSNCVLQLGGTQVYVKPLTEMTVTKFAQTPDNRMSTNVDIKNGGLTVNVKKDRKRTDMRVSTPNITASVTGSFGSFESRAGQPDRVDFDSGACQVQNTATGASMTIGAGEQTTSELISALEAVKESRAVALTPRGSTKFEVKVAKLLPENGASLPSELNSEQGNVAFQRVIDQSSSNVDDAQRLNDLGFNTNVPPPLRRRILSKLHR